MQTADYTLWIERIWDRQMPLQELLTHAEHLAARPALVAALYQAWLQRHGGPESAIPAFNLGVLLATHGDSAEAESAYRRALELRPNLGSARINLGLMLERRGQAEAALEQWSAVADEAEDAGAEALPLRTTALNHIGRLQENRKQYLAASQALERSLRLNPEQPDVIHHLVFQRQKQCAWPVYEPVGKVSAQALRAGTSALAMINISDDPAAQLEAAHSFVRRRLPHEFPRLSPADGYGHEKLRVAYCSGDFCTHPVAMLTVELFEHHDRNRFETYAFCWSPEDGGPLRRRILAAVDHYIPVHGKSEAEIADLIREHEIDILVDLQGQTSGAKIEVLARRPAPIQITYLGLPATTGLPGVDYVIADRYLIPEDQAQYYSEKPIYMPDVYQVSDRKREHSAAPTRKSCGLPARKFVFCSFNNNHKYTAEVFATWMNILRRVPNSVLWLLADNPWAEANLRKEAEQHGIEAKRLIFAKRAAPADYLARYLVADLFLDTFPFNAGTTANDALWMGLPVLTMSGKSFASRMAGALLTAAGLPELITTDLQAYEDAAVSLATTPAQRKALHQKLAKARDERPLFDSLRFTRALEEEYRKLVDELPVAPDTAVEAFQEIAQPTRQAEMVGGRVERPAAHAWDLIAIVEQAETRQKNGNLSGAIEVYRQSLKRRHTKDDWMLQFNLGVLLQQAGKSRDARDAFEKTLRQRPDFRLARVALSTMR